MASIWDILQGNFPAAQRYKEGYAQMPSYLQDPYLGLSTGKVGDVTKGLLSKTQFEKAQEIASKNAETLLGLPKGNTAMDRAKAMGYDTPAYHGTSKNFNEFIGNPAKENQIFVALSPLEANVHAIGTQGSNIMPLLVNKGNRAKGIADWAGEDAYANLANKYGKDSFYVRDDYNSPINLSILNPSNIRSKFAAFDPARANEPDLLAATMAFPISGLLQEPKEKKKKK